MILNLCQLRKDYKAIYKKDWKTAKKVSILIEVTKLDLSYNNKMCTQGKRLTILEILQIAKCSLRTLQRLKRNYRLNGLKGLTPKKRGHRIKRELEYGVKNQIREYRETYSFIKTGESSRRLFFIFRKFHKDSQCFCHIFSSFFENCFIALKVV